MTIAYVPGSFADSHTGNSASARTLAWGAANGSGSLLGVIVATFNASITLTVIDDQNGSYTQAGTYGLNSNNTSVRVSIWYVWNCMGGVTPTVTVTPSASAYVEFSLQEYSGIQSTSDPLHASTSTVTTTTSTSLATGSCTAAAGELVIGAYTQGSSNLVSCTVGSPFTMRENYLQGGTNTGLGVADDVNAAGSEGVTFTTSATVAWAGIAASFKPAPAGGVSRLLASLGAGR